MPRIRTKSPVFLRKLEILTVLPTAYGEADVQPSLLPGYFSIPLPKCQGLFLEIFGNKLSFTGVTLSPRWGDTMLRIRGERIATPVCGLVRNDSWFRSFPQSIRCKPYREVCHCEEHSEAILICMIVSGNHTVKNATWQSVTPASEGCSAAIGRCIPLSC